MILRETAIAGAYLIALERHADERGWFARTYCREEFARLGLDPAVAQCSSSYNRERHTLRGLHYQMAPHGEVKLVRCTRGAVWDAIVDLRPDSPSYRRWYGAVLDGEQSLELYVPAGCAHGFLTLTGDAEVHYQISAPHHPEAGRGVRWDDPAFGIEWPAFPEVISERDRNYPDWLGAEG